MIVTCGHLSDDDVAVSTVSISDHTVQDELWYLCGLPAACRPTQDHHLLVMDHTH